MRPQHLARARWYLVTLAVLCGCSVALVGETGSFVVGVVSVVLTLAGRMRTKPPGPVSVTRWRAASWLTAGTLIAGGVLGTSLIFLAVVLVAWLQVHRAWVGKRATDDRLALLIGLLQLLVGCILSVSPALGPLFAGYVLTGIPGLLLCELGRMEEADLRPARPDPVPRAATIVYVSAMGPVALALSIAFFLAIPRVEAGGVLPGGSTNSVSGFGANVELGDVGAIKNNPSIAVRMTVVDGNGKRVDGPFYLQGAVLDHFDGRAWNTTVGGGRRGSQKKAPVPSSSDKIRIQELMVEPLGEDVIFGIAEVVEIKGLQSPASWDSNGAWRSNGSDQRLTYQVTSYPYRKDPGDAIPNPITSARTQAEENAARARWTQLPGDLDPRITPLAREIAGRAGPDATPFEQATAVADWLQTEFTYTVVPDDAGLRQPLSTFLFETRAGHCEYFATALAVLLRTLGLPTRVVNGFYGGEWNEFGGYYLFRQQDAHSWVQVNFGTAGWIVMDATPEAGAPAATSFLRKIVDVAVADWYEVVLDYDLAIQLDFLKRVFMGSSGMSRGTSMPGLGGSVPLLAFLALVGIGFVSFRMLLAWLAGEKEVQRRPAGRIARIHERTRRQVARRGWNIPPSLPPVEAAQWLAVRVGPSARPLEELAWLVYRVRYAGEDEDLLLPIARDVADKLGTLPRRKNVP